MASTPWILDNKSQIWATFRRKLTIGHKSTSSSFEKLIFKIFFCLTKFSLLTHGLDLGLNLKKRTLVKKIFGADFVITRVKPFRKVNFQLCTNCLGSRRSTSHMWLFVKRKKVSIIWRSKLCSRMIINKKKSDSSWDKYLNGLWRM